VACFGQTPPLGYTLNDQNLDLCPADPDKIEPGFCGCGIPETDCDPNQTPTIETLAASPDPVPQGTDLTLTATGVSDPDGHVVLVEFYRDTNGDGEAAKKLGQAPSQPAIFEGFHVSGSEPVPFFHSLGVWDEHDEPLGTADGAQGWNLTLATADWALGQHTLFARAQDNHAAWSDPVGVTASVYDVHPPLFMGAVPLFARKEARFTVPNGGETAITVQAIGWSEPFTIRAADEPSGEQAWQVAPGSSRGYVIAFAPVEDGQAEVLLALASNDGTGSIARISGLGVAGWRNPLEPYDVDWNGHVAPQDVLHLINEINRSGGGTLPLRTAERPGLPLFLDPSGEGDLTANDVLQVINRLNRDASGQSSGSDGKGEATDGWEPPGWESLLDDPMADLPHWDAYFGELAG
jgi:hypothetical protein